VHTPGGKPVIAVPGQVPQSPVITVLPRLVRVVAEIAPYVLASPMTIGAARFSMVGWARERMLNCVVARAKRASLPVLNMVHFILSEAFELLVIIGRYGWITGQMKKEELLKKTEMGNG
jgi:hypothetical protein